MNKSIILNVLTAVFSAATAAAYTVGGSPIAGGLFAVFACLEGIRWSVPRTPVDPLFRKLCFALIGLGFFSSLLGLGVALTLGFVGTLLATLALLFGTLARPAKKETP